MYDYKYGIDVGIEGNIRKNYYASWNVIIDQEIQFDKRIMHPPDNMINSLISFVNSLVYAKVLSEIYHTQQIGRASCRERVY